MRKSFSGGRRSKCCMNCLPPSIVRMYTVYLVMRPLGLAGGSQDTNTLWASAARAFTP